MGFFKNIHIEIMEWRDRGRSIEDTYIYFKDYIEMSDLVKIFKDELDVPAAVDGVDISEESTVSEPA
jgi:hypothetical protein